jgi:hypothetical protein
MPPMIQAMRRRFGPPQALTSRLPTSMAAPAAEMTAPAAASVAKETISGMRSTLVKERAKFTPA